MLIVTSFLLVVSCQKEDLGDLREVVYVRRAGADMPAYIYGNGRSRIFVIILHGGPGGSGREYRMGGYSDDLEERYAVVYWDQRGQGMSQGHYDKEMVNLRDMAEDVQALALVLKHKYGDDISLFLMGHSWGGMLGTAVITTEDYQHLFNGWIEVDGAHDMPQVYKGGIEDMIRVGKEQIRQGHDSAFWRRQVSFAESLDPDVLNSDDFGELNERAGKAETKLIKWGVIHEGDVSLKALGMLMNNNMITTSVAGMFTSGYLIDHQDLLHISLADSLYKVTIPCLFIWGVHDLIVSPSLAQPAFDSVNTPEKRLVVFNNSGHSPMMSERELFVQEVEEFVEKYK